MQTSPFQNHIDANIAEDHAFLVKRYLCLLLLFGALLGLFAQEAAFASAPALPVQDMAIAASAMSDECAEMMNIDKSQDKKPCTGLTLDCIAKMGCALPLAPPTIAAPIAAKALVRDLFDPLAVTQLHGRTIGPDPDPPLHLG